MDNETREKFKHKLDEMIKDALENESIARDLQREVEQKRSWMEMLSKSGSNSRSRRNKEEAADMETQVAELEQQAARQWEVVGNLCIRYMRCKRSTCFESWLGLYRVCDFSFWL
ncbi:hypothetical protein J3458_002250 [Metarhizium acridum]|uniref:uncharacterized protein n=1 Tax=Metarhizium acridum TaxID=92637 RepID=UPI001C6AFBF3|nr:hypothetical protein J3458_002250 [Metarhizium acridum]